MPNDDSTKIVWNGLVRCQDGKARRGRLIRLIGMAGQTMRFEFIDRSDAMGVSQWKYRNDKDAFRLLAAAYLDLLQQMEESRP